MMGGASSPHEGSVRTGSHRRRPEEAPVHRRVHFLRGGFARQVAAAFVLLLCGSAAAAEGTLEKIARTGAIAVGYQVGSAPFAYIDEAGKPAGYSIDLCLSIAEAVKRELKMPHLSVLMAPLTVEQRLQAVMDGTADIECGSSTHTLARRERVDFTLPIFVDGAALLVTKVSRIRKIEDLDGKKVAVIAGTTTESVVKDQLRRVGARTSVLEVADHVEGVRALEAGAADAYVSDRTILLGIMRKAKDPDSLLVSDHPLSYEPYGLVVRRNDADFRLLADRTLARLYRTREIDGLLLRWFGDASATPSALTAMYMLSSIPE